MYIGQISDKYRVIPLYPMHITCACAFLDHTYNIYIYVCVCYMQLLCDYVYLDIYIYIYTYHIYPYEANVHPMFHWDLLPLWFVKGFIEIWFRAHLGMVYWDCLWGLHI